MTTAQPKSSSATPKGRFWAIVRLSAFVAAVAGVYAVFWIYRARATTSEVLSSVGGEMMQYASATAQDEPRQIYINGVRFGFGSGHTDDSVETVLNFFHGRCRQRDGGLSALFAQAVAEGRLPGAEPDFGDRFMRSMDPSGRGFATCFDFGPQSLSIGDLGSRLIRAVETRDLHELGGFRYVYAEPVGSRANPSTHFLVVHTDDAFDLDDLFPAEGDAPGMDPPGFPRLPGLRRILSAWEDGFGHGLTVYAGETQVRPRAHLERSLVAEGFRILQAPETQSAPAVPPRRARRGFVAERHGRTFAVTFAERARDGHTDHVVSVVSASDSSN